MRSDNRLSRMLHVLLHMAEQDAPLTSETIGKMLNTNPVVVRRMMSGLRERGYVPVSYTHLSTARTSPTGRRRRATSPRCSSSRWCTTP